MHHGQICCHNTDYVHANGHNRTITVILAKLCIKHTDDGSLVIRDMLEQFLIFLNDYVHANRHDGTITVILAKHCINLPDDGSLVIRNALGQ